MSSNAPIAEASSWFYADASNQPIGPLSFDELQRLAAVGTIRPETLVIENGANEWRSFGSVCPMQPPPIPTRQRSSRKVLWCVVAIALLVLSLLGGVVSVMEKLAKRNPPQRANQRITHSAPKASKDDYILLKGGAIYADEETLSEMESASERGGEAGTNALKRLSEAGKIWSAEANTLVSVVRDHGPLGTVLVKAKNPHGKKLTEFWASGMSLIPMTDARAQSIMRNACSRSDFKWIFDGTNARIVGDAGVENFAGLLQGIYEGHVSLTQASKVAFESSAVLADFKYVAGDHLIYEVVSNQGRVFQFAMLRDRAYEQEQLKHYKSLEDFYAENKGMLSSGDQLEQGVVVVVGMEPFTTKSSFVRQIPVVACVQFVD